MRSINENQQFDTDFWLGYGASNSAYYVGRNPDYYVEHGAYDGNTENMTALTFAEPVETRSMLVQVTVPNGGADQDVRLYELEVLAVDEDQVAARRVMAKIDAIGQVTKDSDAAIAAAREAYDALTETQKAQVSNYQTLLDAEKTYELCLLVDAAEAAKRAAEDAQKKAEEARTAAEEAEGRRGRRHSAADDKGSRPGGQGRYPGRQGPGQAGRGRRQGRSGGRRSCSQGCWGNRTRRQPGGGEGRRGLEAADEAANAAKSPGGGREASGPLRPPGQGGRGPEDGGRGPEGCQEAAESPPRTRPLPGGPCPCEGRGPREAEAARDAAEEAKDAANASREAAEAHNLAAAEEARKAADEAARAAAAASEAWQAPPRPPRPW